MFGINKRQEFANGKIIVMDFRKLNANDFRPYHNENDLKNGSILFAVDGKVFIDSKDMWCVTYRTAFEAMIPLSRYELECMRKTYRAKHPNIKSEKDLVKMNLEEIESFKEALMIVMIPFELERRERERKYYAKPRR